MTSSLSPSQQMLQNQHLAQLANELKLSGLATTGLLLEGLTAHGLSPGLALAALRVARRGQNGLAKVLLVPVSGLSGHDLDYLVARYLHALTGAEPYGMLTGFLGWICWLQSRPYHSVPLLQ